MCRRKKTASMGGCLACVAGLAHSAGMNHTDVMLRIVEMAKVGGALPADEAVSLVASLIDGLDMRADSYEKDVERLLRLGATIWDLASGPGGAHAPTWVPTMLRP